MVKKYNKYDLSGDYGIGYATNSDDIFYFDLEDYDKIKYFAWYCNNKDGRKYMESKSKDRCFSVHREVMDAKKEEYIDHKDGKTLDCRKSNLRVATNQENSYNCKISKNNSTGFTGVTWDKTRNRWKASIKHNYKNIYIGRFKYKDDAIIARLKKEKELFGDFSGQRHLFEQYNI